MKAQVQNQMPNNFYPGQVGSSPMINQTNKLGLPPQHRSPAIPPSSKYGAPVGESMLGGIGNNEADIRRREANRN